MVHFNWLQLIPNVSHDNLHLVTASVAAGSLFVLSIVGRAALGTGSSAIEPSSKFSIKGIFEAYTGFIAGMAETVIGKDGILYVPLFGSIFLFVFINNIIGLIPGMTPATDNINTGVAIGIFSFIVYNYLGIKEHGFHYIKQFTGPILPLAPLLICVELISHILRPLTLGLRLKTNMEGDHIVLGIALDLTGYFVLPVLFYGLGLFVCFMQAFIFMLLSMIYVSMAISHDH